MQFFFLLLFLAPLFLFADDLVTEKGKVYEDYKILNVFPLGIHISYKHKKETRKATIQFQQLTDDFLQNYQTTNPIVKETFAAKLETRRKLYDLEAKREEALQLLDLKRDETMNLSRDGKITKERKKQIYFQLKEEKKRILQKFKTENSRLETREKQRIETAVKKAYAEADKDAAKREN